MIYFNGLISFLLNLSFNNLREPSFISKLLLNNFKNSIYYTSETMVVNFIAILILLGIIIFIILSIGHKIIIAINNFFEGNKH